MRTIVSQITIDAPAATVWSVLTDFDAFGEWNPHVVALRGDLEIGSSLEARFANGMTFRPVVTEVKDGSVLEWHGKLGVRGIFDGRHRFELQPGDTGTVLVQSEEFSGVLVPLMRRLIDRTKREFEAVNEAMSERVASVI